MAHPHLRERKTVRRVSDPAFEQFDIPGLPVKFSDWPDRTDLKASRLGEDNEAILSEMLGLSTGEIIERALCGSGAAEATCRGACNGVVLTIAAPWSAGVVIGKRQPGSAQKL